MKQKSVNKKLKDHVERAKTDKEELRDKCEVLEEEYAAIKKQLQTEIENQKFLGDGGFGFGGSFLEADQQRSRDGSMMASKRFRGSVLDQDLGVVNEFQEAGLDNEVIDNELS